jgi:uncharacterized protein
MAEEMNAAMVSGTDIYQNGSFSDIFARRWYEWTSYIIFAGIIQGPGVLSFFLFGLAGVKSGVLQTPDARLWRQARRIYLPIGFVVSGLGAYIIMTSSGSMSGQGMAGSALITFGAPLSSLGYLGLIAKWAETPMTRTKLFFARAGTSSLTAYLLQSLILSFIFCGYGFGLYAKLGAANCIAIALLTAIVTLSFSSLWRQRFARGPMEALLRRWTYLGAR